MWELRRNGTARQVRLVTENVRVGIVHCDAEYRYTFVNRHWAERRRLKPEQVIGKRIWEVVGEEDWAMFGHYVRACLAGNAIEFELELEFPYRPGEPQFVHSCYEPEWRNGKVVGLIAAITNITSVKHAEAARREHEAKFRAMFDLSSVGHVEVDIESGRFLRANAAMCKLLGYTEAELLVRTVFDTTHPDDRYHAGEPLRRMTAGESAVADVEKRCIRKDGSAVWVRVTANVVRDASGQPLRNIAVIQNIDASKQRGEKVNLLTREVNHRAKNILSVVQAIALQTATATPEDFIERFAERIQARSQPIRTSWSKMNGMGLRSPT
jgi:PAS domain S-box-containing protein